MKELQAVLTLLLAFPGTKVVDADPKLRAEVLRLAEKMERLKKENAA